MEPVPPWGVVGLVGLVAIAGVAFLLLCAWSWKAGVRWVDALWMSDQGEPAWWRRYTWFCVVAVLVNGAVSIHRYSIGSWIVGTIQLVPLAGVVAIWMWMRRVRRRAMEDRDG